MMDGSRFGPLLGVISVGNVYCKFLVYAARNAEILTCHEVKLQPIVCSPGWLEFDPLELWRNVVECIEAASRNLIILDINPRDLIALGLTNQRGTSVLWDKQSGIPLCNAISWSDIRTSSTVKELLARLKDRKNFLKSTCGLPISPCFSALKVKWLMDNVPSINESITNEKCFFGTLDSWILWNLTGGIEGGIHTTDVSNAAYTMLMNLETLQWDSKLLKFFKIPKYILPNIKSSSECYGFIHDGPLRGIPIASCLGDQTAALLGQMCTQTTQCTSTIDEGCFLMVNTGQEIIESENGLLTTVAFQLGPQEKPIYALEGAISNAGSAISWLKDQLQLNTEINQNSYSTVTGYGNLGFGDTSMMSSGCSTVGFSLTDNNINSKKSEIIFVPAFNGIYSPYWKYDARGIILGVNSQTTGEQITQAAYEATCFQMRDILDSFRKDTPTWQPLERLIIGGEFSEKNSLVQLMADICGIVIERPQTTSPSCLGAMMAAGIAMEVLSLENSDLLYPPPSDLFYPTTTVNRREVLCKRWKYAVDKCLAWDNFDKFEEEMSNFAKQEKDPNLPIRCSIPGGIFITSCFVLLLVAKHLQSRNIF